MNHLKTEPFFSPSVFIKHHKWRNISVLFHQHSSDMHHNFKSKYQSHINFNLFSECFFMFNPVFNIYPTWNWWICLFLFSFITILLAIWKMGRRWYLLNRYRSGISIFSLFRCIHFHILFLCFNHFYQSTGYLSM